MSGNFSKFDERTDQLQEAVKDAKCTLEEMNEAGDLEDRLEASQAVEDAEYNLSRHLLTDQQEDKPEPMWPDFQATDEPKDESS